MKFKFKFLIFFIFLSYLFNSHVTYAADVNYFNEMAKKVETNVFLEIVNQNLNIGNQNNNDGDQDNNGDDPNENSEDLEVNNSGVDVANYENEAYLNDVTNVLFDGGDPYSLNRYSLDYD